MKIRTDCKKEYEDLENATTLIIEGELRNGSELDLKKETEKILFQNTNIVIDMKKVSYINSSSVGILVVASRKFKDSKKKFVLFNISDCVSNLLDTLGLRDYFTIDKDKEKN